MTVEELDAMEVGRHVWDKKARRWERTARGWKAQYGTAWCQSLDLELCRPITSIDPAPKPTPDMVSHPPHYTSHPSGIECVQITEHMGFLIGNAVKYLWRADLKNDAIEDLKKAAWCIDREIQKRESNL